MFIKPKNGIIIRDPITKAPVPETGREVPESGYWMRRLRDGDIIKESVSTGSLTAIAKPITQAD